MVNLRVIANRATSGVNPNVTAVLRVSTGYVTNAAGKQVPSYAPPTPVTLQAQALTRKELEHLDSLNIQGAEVAVYSNLQMSAADRVTGSGGDMLQFNGFWWLVIAELEQWSTAGWGRVALRKQRTGPA